MRIGLDLDNTIACYDEVFREAAIELALCGTEETLSKTALRDALRAAGREDDWTRLQGRAYGSGMCGASPYPGVLGFLRSAAAAHFELMIVSHRTREPYLGPKTDLHAAAKAWLAQQQITGGDSPISMDAVYLELTKEAKMARIESLNCEVFVDDLPEFLSDPAFPAKVRRIWFNPSGRDDTSTLETIHSWSELGRRLLT